MDREIERRLVEDAKRSPAAFGKLFEEYYKPIHRYALHRTGNAAAADDVTAETFFKALNKISGFKWAGVPFSAWLYRIAGNEVINYFRRGAREPSGFELNPDGVTQREPASTQDMEKELLEAQEKIDNSAAYIRAKEALKTLPEKYREVLTLRFLEDKKIMEICEILGKNEGTVKSLISRGTARLKVYFEKDAGAQPLPGGGVINNESNRKGGS
jgi:RNA polymerase sigma-70 factor (ECF subfamily)